MPKFSIIIPVYNVEMYLHACVDSVLSQSFCDFEVLLVDDGSPDGCPDICDAYAAADERVTAIHKMNGGLSDARNVGLRAARGEYVIFLDSDDYYLSTNFFEEINAKIVKNDCDAVFFRRRKYSEESGTLEPPPALYPEMEEMTCGEILCCLSQRDMLDANASMKATRRTFLIENKLYFKKGIFSEDVEWFFRYAPLLQSVELLNCPAYCYRMREGSITHSITEKNVLDLFSSVESYADVIRDCQSETRVALLNYMAYQYYIILGLCHNTLQGSARSDLQKKLRHYTWLRDYSISRKTKLCAILLRCMGVRFTSAVLGGYIKEK